MTNIMNTTKMDLDLRGIFEKNGTYDYSDDYVYVDECKPEGNDRFKTIFIPVLYSLAMIVGLLGNGLLLVVLFQKRRAWSVTDTFVLHLGIADSLLLLVTLPFWADQATKSQRWSFGTPLCKISGAMFTINFYCGIFLLVCISVDRYLSVVHAAQIFPRRRAWMVHFSCLSVWLLSLLLSIPDWLFTLAVKDEEQDKMECIHNYQLFSQSQTEWRLASRLLYHIVGFLLPSAVLIFCYASILLHLKRGSQGLQKQRAVRVILALVAVFFLCWTPYNITLMVDTIFNTPNMPQEPATATAGCQKTRSCLETGLLVTYALACVHSCLNPLLYFGLCRNFRERAIVMLRCATGQEVGSSLSLWELGLGEELLPGQASEKVVLKAINTQQQAQSTQS